MSLSNTIDAYLDKQLSFPRLPESTRSAIVAQIKKHPEAYAMAPIKLRWTDDLPLNFHPAATGARFVFTPVGAG